MPIEFWFDFISPYAYLASTRIEALAAAHGRALLWRPFRLGVAVVKVMGLRPVMQTPLKSDYIRRDVRRMAKVLDIPFRGVSFEPQPLPPGRVMLAAPAAAQPALASCMLRMQWAEGLDLADAAVLRSAVEECGLPTGLVDAALQDEGTREALNALTREGTGKGVFGSPTFVVGDELFWGVDRLWLLDAYLRAGEKFEPASLPKKIAAGGRPPAARRSVLPHVEASSTDRQDEE